MLKTNPYQQVLPPLKSIEIKGDQIVNISNIRVKNLSDLENPFQKVSKLFNLKHENVLSHENVSILYDEGLEDEAYRIEVGAEIKLYAKTDAGIFYAAITLTNLIMMEVALPYATLEDAPSVVERALHLDCGRKYFSKEWIMKFIDDLAKRKMNTLQMHFSENLGFRIESKIFPEIVSDKHLKQDEVLEIIKYAQDLFIQIIPSLDAPGHLRHILEVYPQYALEGTKKEAIDISNPKARTFMKELYDEFSDLFKSSKYFNIGSDEFVDFETIDSFTPLVDYARDILKIDDASAIDTYIDFINDMASHLEDKGFIVRVWNDGIHRLNQSEKIPLKTSIEICYWTKYHKYMAPLEVFEDKGYRIINYHAENFYYVFHVDVGIKLYKTEDWFESWNPHKFTFGQETKNESKVLGSSYAIWCDAPDIGTVRRVYNDTFEPIWAMAVKSWNKDTRLSYDAFTNLILNYYL